MPREVLREPGTNGDPEAPSVSLGSAFIAEDRDDDWVFVFSPETEGFIEETVDVFSRLPD